ncbi:glycosyltransferase [Paeniglutamicibacter antarcticus]|uniref:Glycosyltransferase n=1 Tax=Arthrobacter terrae TaxID=2935737 RepID=A0A931CMV6_9MICC|nr:glycosyltransferase [Arthrobacter terrae]
MVIAVLTYCRPDRIASVLPLLVRQCHSIPAPATVLVIDNDPEASAKLVVHGLASEGVRYVHEPVPGIAAARSRALAEAGDAHLLVFIDDDEVPSDEWLLHLLKLYRRTSAAAVVGPVISEYACVPDPWITAGEFFRRRRMPTGTPVTVAATNNLLLDLEQIRAMNLDFDRRFGLLGGEDTLFTRQIVERGGTMVWCDEAIVMDQVPEDRLTREWVLRRAFSSGNSWSRVSLELASGKPARRRQRVRLLASGGVRIAGGLAKSTAGILGMSVARRAKGLRTMARGAGMTSGAFGYAYREYHRP